MGVWDRLFGRKDRDALTPLYNAVVAEARRPDWYLAGQVPDTLDGRFDMVAAVLSLVLLRLEDEGESGRAPSAWLTEIFVEDMDGQLRERGIGDIVVGKHIGKLMASLGGRLGAYREALADEDGGTLESAVRRNVTLADAQPPQPLAARLRAFAERLSDTPAADILAGNVPR